MQYVSGCFFQLLTLLFIGLKLGGSISWSWWWVLSPLWIPITILILVCILVTVAIYVKDGVYDRL